MKYKCGHCNKSYTANRWNTHTAREIGNRYNGGNVEDIILIEDITVDDPDEDCFYICPGCNETCYIDEGKITEVE